MSSTIKLTNTTAWAQAFCRLQPLTGVGGIAGEPSVTNANGVKQFILGPPFAWRWNRKTNSAITTIVGQQDYTIVVPDFGWLEGGSISDGTRMYGLQPRLMLEDSVDQGRPLLVSAQVDDGAGNITFRFSQVPDSIYTVKLIYQMAAPLITMAGGSWAPIPDSLAYLFNSGFLASCLEVIDDSRFPVEYSKFIKSVIAANDGLTDTEINIFLSEKLIDQREIQGQQLNTQQGRVARGT
jgi:hypothetical protein